MLAGEEENDLSSPDCDQTREVSGVVDRCTRPRGLDTLQEQGAPLCA